MPRYDFAVFDGKWIEDEQGEIFSDDAQALAHGRQVVREITRGNHNRFSGWTLEITEGERIVGSIPCEIDGAPTKKNPARPPRRPAASTTSP